MKELIITLLTIAALPLTAQYAGGQGDGHDLAFAVTDLQALSLSPELYGGGTGDGYDERGANSTLVPLSIAPELYGGGTGDGYDERGANSTLVPLSISPELYGGGTGDGHDRQEADAKVLPLAIAPELYGGGIGDGYNTKLAANFEIPLPLNLLEFTATPDQKSVLLEWTTSDESDTDRFTVERTAGGRDFEQVGYLAAAGYSEPGATLTYRLIDESPLPGVSYYRLKTQNFDGSYQYSELRQVAYGGGVNDDWLISVSPNPTDGFIDLVVNGIAEQGAKPDISLYDLTGRQRLVTRERRGASVRLDMRELPGGIYFLRVSGVSGYERTLRIIRR